MRSAIRRHITFANVALTAALVFAMTGGAYAAGKYLITSTKQIKPSVLASLKGKVGPAGRAGANGAAGPVGAQGPAGPAGAVGAKGETGTTGATGATGKEGKAGKEGSPWTDGGTLPVGSTETGTLTTPSVALKNEPFAYVAVPISFSIPLAAELPEDHVEVIKENTTGTNCTGSSGNPTAPSGFLCVYIAEEKPAAPAEITYVVRKSGSGEILGASTAGAVVGMILPEGEHQVFGTWAVTG